VTARSGALLAIVVIGSCGYGVYSNYYAVQPAPPVPSKPAPEIAAQKSPSSVGERAVAGGDHPWICGSTKEAFDDAMKWAVLKDQDEMARSLAKTHSTLLAPGAHVKVLDRSILLRKVRLLDADKLSALLPPDKECWVETEALTR
jgi:hypothetical protein